MNHIYRLVWSQLSNAWVAVAETARGRGKTSRSKLVLVALSLSGTAVQAAPLGGQVSAGSGSISSSGTTTTITQSSQNLSLNWNSFNIGRQETVNFVQPSASAIAVNRIADTNGTQILGQLNANGQVYLINPNGILFGAGAQVNVGGLVASTLGIGDAALNGAARSFAGTGAGSIVNQGTIKVANGGYVALLGNTVSNQGTINAPLGAVALGAGSAVTLTFDGNSLVKMQVDQSTLNNLAENRDLIQADSGMVIMNAGAKDALLASVVNNTGVIQAHTVENRNGTITLLGGMAAGQVNVGGTLDASAPNGGNGGFIETSAARVKIASDAGVTTRAPGGKSGTWLIDPVDYTIAASGGDQTGAQLSAALSGGNVTIQSANGTSGTAGNVNVNDTVSWSANTLTLNAQNNININSTMTATGSAGLALQYGQGAVAAGNTSTDMVNAPVNMATGTSFSTKLGSDGVTLNYTVINSLGVQGPPAGVSLQGMAATANLAKNYVLGSNIDATETSGWNSNAGFTPIGNSSSNFTGNFDGLGHTISGLTINQPGGSGVGLFGTAGAGSVIRNVGLAGGSMVGHDTVGGLAGASMNNTISNSYSTAAVSSGGNAGGTIGGLVGINLYGTISNSYATGAVSVVNFTGNDGIGGLVGNNSGTISNSHATGAINAASTSVRIGGLVGTNSGTISNSYATGTIGSGAITNINYVGGLVGYISGGSIGNSYATGAVIGGSGSSYLGGLVGLKSSGTISNSYATGAVNGHNYVGGLVGNSQGGAINNSYATGAASNDSAGSAAGGLVGLLSSSSISNSYATGAVSGSSNGIGGLVGSNSSGTVSNSYWNTTTSGQSTSAGGLGSGLTTSQMLQQSNFSGWDFSGTWISYSGQTAPLLRSFMTPLTVTANNVTKTYDSYAYSSGSVSYSVASSNLIGYLLGSVSYSGTSQGATNVGSYVITPGGLYSNQQGYIISYASGTLTVNPASLTVTGITASNKTYDAGTAATLSGTAAVTALGSDVITVSGTGVGIFANKNVGNGKAVTVSGYTLSGAAAGNYSIVQPAGLTANITPASLAVTGVTASNKTYDAGTGATLAGTAAVTVLGSDVVSLGGTGVGTFANKNVGNGKTVTVSGYTLSGADAGNYSIVQPTGLTANITPANLAVTGITANNKVYDTSAAATLAGTAAITALGSDVVSLGGAGVGTFANKNVGNGKTVTVSGYTLSGADAGNYSIVQPTGLTANITPASLAVTGITANNKVYDTSAAATLAGTAAITALGSDVVSLGGTGVGTFANKNVGNGKAVTVSGYTLSGADAGNYSIVQPTGLTANITPASLAVTGVTASNKTYDAGTGATLAGTAAVTALGSDVVSLGGAGVGTFADKNVGNGKAVTISGYTLSGTDAGNYAIVQPTGLTANITPANLAVTGVTANNKVYDTSAGATLAGTATMTALGSDVVNLGGAGVGTFANKNVGNGKTVTVSGYTLSGTDAGNYTIVQPTGLTANITPASLVITGLTAGSKVYDAGTAATLAGTAAITPLGSDVVSLGGTGVGTFANKNVGNGKTVTVSGYTLSGADAGNYNLTANLSANITPAALSVSGITANNKAYDGTTSATVNTAGATLSPVIGTDQVTLRSTGAFADAAIGTGKTVNLSNSLAGADGGNYTLSGQTTTLANISPAPVVSANPDVAPLPQTLLSPQIRNTIADVQSPSLASLQLGPPLPLQLPPPAIALHQDDGGSDKSSELPASRPVNILPGNLPPAPTLQILDAGVKLPPASIPDKLN